MVSRGEYFVTSKNLAVRVFLQLLKVKHLDEERVDTNDEDQDNEVWNEEGELSTHIFIKELRVETPRAFFKLPQHSRTHEQRFNLLLLLLAFFMKCFS